MCDYHHSAHCPISKLFRISAFGTRLRFYCVDTGDGTAPVLPPRLPRDPEIINDTAPSEQWDCDILEAEGEERLWEIVREIQRAYASAANM